MSSDLKVNEESEDKEIGSQSVGQSADRGRRKRESGAGYGVHNEGNRRGWDSTTNPRIGDRDSHLPEGS